MNNKVIGWEGVVNEDTPEAVKLGFVLWFEKKLQNIDHRDTVYIKWLLETSIADGLQKWEAINRIIATGYIRYLFL